MHRKNEGLAWLALMLVVSGCRTPCAADDKPTPEQLARERKAMLRGQGICKELVTPKVTVRGDDLVLTSSRDNLIGHRNDLATDEVTRFVPLQNRLVMYRDHFRAVRAAEPFEPTFYLDVDTTIEPARAVALLESAAGVGFPRARVRATDFAMDVNGWVRRPVDIDRPPIALCVEPRGSGHLHLRFDGRVKPARDLETAALADEIGKMCEGEGGCADVLGIGEIDGASFLEQARLAQAALSAPPFATRPPRLVFMTKAPMSVAWGATTGLRPCRS